MIKLEKKKNAIFSGVLGQTSTGLSINDHSLKVAVVRKRRKGSFFKNLGEISLDRKTLKNGTVYHEEKLKEALAEIKKSYRLNFVNISIPSEQTHFSRIKMPQLGSETAFRKALLFHLGKQTNLPEEDILFTYKQAFENDHYKEIVVHAFSKEVLNQYRRIFREAGITPVYFETEGESLRRAIPYSGETFIIVDYGKTKTVVSVIKNGLLYDLQHTDVLGRSFLKDELNNFLISWLQNEDEPIKKMILCGDASLAKGLSEYLSSALRIPVERANVWQTLSYKGEIPDLDKKEFVGHFRAIGSALL